MKPEINSDSEKMLVKFGKEALLLLQNSRGSEDWMRSAGFSGPYDPELGDELALCHFPVPYSKFASSGYPKDVVQDCDTVVFEIYRGDESRNIKPSIAILSFDNDKPYPLQRIPLAYYDNDTQSWKRNSPVNGVETIPLQYSYFPEKHPEPKEPDRYAELRERVRESGFNLDSGKQLFPDDLTDFIIQCQSDTFPTRKEYRDVHRLLANLGYDLKAAVGEEYFEGVYAMMASLPRQDTLVEFGMVHGRIYLDCVNDLMSVAFIDTFNRVDNSFDEAKEVFMGKSSEELRIIFAKWPVARRDDMSVVTAGDILAAVNKYATNLPDSEGKEILLRTMNLHLYVAFSSLKEQELVNDNFNHYQAFLLRWNTLATYITVARLLGEPNCPSYALHRARCRGMAVQCMDDDTDVYEDIKNGSVSITRGFLNELTAKNPDVEEGTDKWSELVMLARDKTAALAYQLDPAPGVKG